MVPDNKYDDEDEYANQTRRNQHTVEYTNQHTVEYTYRERSAHPYNSQPGQHDLTDPLRPNLVSICSTTMFIPMLYRVATCTQMPTAVLAFLLHVSFPYLISMSNTQNGPKGSTLAGIVLGGMRS
jgi:hypothetical protein